MDGQDATAKPTKPRQQLRRMTAVEVRVHFGPVLAVLMQNSIDPADPLCMARLIAAALQLAHQRSVAHAAAHQLFAIARARPIVHALLVAAGVPMKLARVPIGGNRRHRASVGLEAANPWRGN